MTCDERKDLMLLYATGATDDAETLDLREHLADGCPQCAEALKQAEAAVSRLPLALDPQRPSPMACERLMQRITQERQASGQVPRWLAAAIAACVGIAVGALGWEKLRPADEDPRVAKLEKTIDNLDTELMFRRGALGARSVALVGLEKQPTQPNASGHVYWDKEHDQWYMYVFDMAPPPEGQEYELWFITPDQKKFPAGTFKVDNSGKGSLNVPVPNDIGPIALAAITNEKIGGSQQPMGQIQLVGNVPQ